MKVRAALATTAALVLTATARGAVDLPREFTTQQLDVNESYVCGVVEFGEANPALEWRSVAPGDALLARLDASGLHVGQRQVCEPEGRMLRQPGSAAASRRCDSFVRVGYSDAGVGPLALCFEADSLQDRRATTSIGGSRAVVALPSGSEVRWSWRRSEHAEITASRAPHAALLGGAAFVGFVDALAHCAQAMDPRPCLRPLLHEGTLPESPYDFAYEDWDAARFAGSSAEYVRSELRSCAEAFRAGVVSVAPGFVNAHSGAFASCLAIQRAGGWRLGAIGGAG